MIDIRDPHRQRTREKRLISSHHHALDAGNETSAPTRLEANLDICVCPGAQLADLFSQFSLWLFAKFVIRGVTVLTCFGLPLAVSYVSMPTYGQDGRHTSPS